MKKYYDIIVVGGGHAGVEAALASARLGKSTALITIERAAIARMSCNPAIGGLAKGHLVRELDVLGGEMGKAIDKTGIQFKLLNRSKGRAVWSPRAQADKIRYERYMQDILGKQPNLDIIESDARALDILENELRGVYLHDGTLINAKACVLTNGTFLRGKIHIGNVQIPAGRYGELPSIGISDQLKNMGFTVGRLKTGTPSRISKRSIDFSKLEIQTGDKDPRPFSHSTHDFDPPNIPCWLAYTHEQTHDILRSALDRSPLYTGKIDGVGPRYCPSIEDKIVRFSDKTQHQLFLEPEWAGSSQWYVNGFSSSLPIDIQIKALRSIPGLEQAEFIKIGYAIEYDYFPSFQIRRSLETKIISGLYFAGQINGTSGYEEAAVQGFMAAVNAARKLEEKSALVLERHEAYIGVLIDDLCSKETSEPYRMFTSLAEYRLLLRWDNAHLRLLNASKEIGLQDNAMLDLFDRVKNETHVLIKKFTKIRVAPGNPLNIPLDTISSISLLVRQQKIGDNHVAGLQKYYFPDYLLDSIDQAYVQTRYEGYIDRQSKQVKKMKQLEVKRIPQNFNYTSIRSLSNEGREKLLKFKPDTIGQASRIRGISPADIQVLLIFLSR
ncbi:MAG: tRNA uridine-5-carboxymethylaminomethyl(34) synthesis enzyme MnmG [Candidatus Neomarinimicrobiota bacterium]|nr:MAG: tRNA uridine-5-carboxymethylaminomethyl(34) synthesis enzyme MnmG [Candidatus Neomarinimicrobiota bacterium]